ncbi:MAG: phytoene/squalene synthase family protein [Devosia nanyangense]|uniref:Phytoene/squalene synthase family protein n=1 Tax=Devosia nanyangense TaxID=1228055 RepID=A0A933KZ49_9HYPH|nr:phytoene/squalene synthase family protein [Devosia nanyangense]
MKAESARYAAEQLRANDRDRYLATLILPPKARDALTALYAFNADIASVRERAREPAAGEIRLQWWADALTGEGHGAVRQNPLADALLDVVDEYGLPVPPLTRMIAARRFDLYDDPMPDVATFEGYAGETVSVLYQLGAMILNGGRPVETGDAAGHLGVAHALIGHLRAFGYNASRRRIVLPWSVLAANGVNQSEVFAGTMSEGLAAGLAQLADMAEGHVTKADVAIRALPRELRAVFAPIAVLRAQHRRLEIESPFQRASDIADWRKIALLSWWTH